MNVQNIQTVCTSPSSISNLYTTVPLHCTSAEFSLLSNRRHRRRLLHFDYVQYVRWIVNQIELCIVNIEMCAMDKMMLVILFVYAILTNLFASWPIECLLLAIWRLALAMRLEWVVSQFGIELSGGLRQRWKRWVFSHWNRCMSQRETRLWTLELECSGWGWRSSDSNRYQSYNSATSDFEHIPSMYVCVRATDDEFPELALLTGLMKTFVRHKRFVHACFTAPNNIEMDWWICHSKWTKTTTE